MAILIDPAVWPAHGGLWSHLISDRDYSELHTFARSLALPRRAFDLDHYDVPERLYHRALELGAIAVSGREVVHSLSASGMRVAARDRSKMTPVRREEYLRHEWEQLGTVLRIDVGHLLAWHELGESLLSRYREHHRGYHSDEHLEDVLLALDQLSMLGEVVTGPTLLAAWFHDAVYDGSPGADERNSADLGVRSMREFPAVSGSMLAQLHALIIATDPAQPQPVHFDTDAVALAFRQLHDADMWILASGPKRYSQYTAGVREEYQHLSDSEFRTGRRRILQGFLAGPRIYLTEPAFSLWEVRARKNLAQEIAALESG